MDKFAVGEVAIYHGLAGASASWNGCECTIAGPRVLGSIQGGGEGYGYLVVDAAGEGEVLEKHLRKRRPPASDELIAWTAALDCIDRAKRSVGVPA